MSDHRCACVRAAAVLVLVLLPSIGSAEPRSLRRPTIAAGAAATANWITTYHALKFYNVEEMNPVLKPLQSTPARMISMGGVIDVASMSTWNMTVGLKHTGSRRRDSGR